MAYKASFLHLFCTKFLLSQLHLIVFVYDNRPRNDLISLENVGDRIFASIKMIVQLIQIIRTKSPTIDLISGREYETFLFVEIAFSFFIRLTAKTRHILTMIYFAACKPWVTLINVCGEGGLRNRWNFLDVIISYTGNIFCQLKAEYIILSIARDIIILDGRPFVADTFGV